MYKNTLLSILGLLLIHASLFGQFIPGNNYFGENNYIQYIAGNLPVIVTTSHGGNLNPNNIPDRECNNPTTITDLYTNQLALEIDTAFVKLMGCHPHIVLTHLSRKKLDNNRDIIDGACGNPIAEQAWKEFHNFIDTAKKYVESQYGKGFYIDLHGHGHPIQRLELGYLLSGGSYQQEDKVLNMLPYTDESSLRSLIPVNINGLTHAQLLRGDFSLGTLLMNKGYPAVPSKQIPFILDGEEYFNGGYNTENYTSVIGGTIDGVQMECNMDGVRDTKENRRKFAESLAQAIKTYLIQHYGLQSQLQNCTEVLPIQLSYFKAFWNDMSKQVVIKWQTTQEINNNYFEIFRSDDGINFISISKIAAKGNSNIPSDYTSYDNTFPVGKIFYRLRQYDKDGQYKDFEIVSVNVPVTTQSIQVDPNCSDNQVKIHIPVDEKLPLQAEIFSATGKTMGKYQLNQPGLNIITANSLSSGIYIVKVYRQHGLPISNKIFK